MPAMTETLLHDRLVAIENKLDTISAAMLDLVRVEEKLATCIEGQTYLRTHMESLERRVAGIELTCAERSSVFHSIKKETGKNSSSTFLSAIAKADTDINWIKALILMFVGSVLGVFMKTLF